MIIKSAISGVYKSEFKSYKEEFQKYLNELRIYSPPPNSYELETLKQYRSQFNYQVESWIKRANEWDDSFKKFEKNVDSILEKFDKKFSKYVKHLEEFERETYKDWKKLEKRIEKLESFK